MTSMLVLHPSTSTLMAGIETDAVSVKPDVFVTTGRAVSVKTASGVFVIAGMDVAIAGVALLTLITTGVGETIGGVLVAGRKGVGAL